MAILCKPQPSSARQTASSPARAGAADKYLKLKGREEGWGVGWGLRAPRRRLRGIRQGSRESLRAPSKTGRGAARRVAAQGEGAASPGPISYQEHSGREEGRLAGKGAPSGIRARATAARDGSVRGVT